MNDYQDIKDPKLELDIKWKLIEELYSDPFYLDEVGPSCLNFNEIYESDILIAENKYESTEENDMNIHDGYDEHVQAQAPVINPDFIEMLSDVAEELSKLSRLKNSNELTDTPKFNKKGEENVIEKSERKFQGTLFEIKEETND